MNEPQQYTAIVVNFGPNLSEQETDKIRQIILTVCERAIRVGMMAVPMEHVEIAFISTLYTYARSEDFNPARVRALVAQMGIPDTGWAAAMIYVILPEDPVIAAATVIELYRRTGGRRFPMLLRRRSWVEMGKTIFALENVPLHRMYEEE